MKKPKKEKKDSKVELPLWPLSVFLAKEDVSETSLLDPNKDLEKLEISLSGKKLGTFYYLKSTDKKPNWLKFFEDKIDPEKMPIFNAHSSAVFLVPVKKRLFALTFGHGRSLLQPLYYETRFGLKVALNCIDPKEIRSIDRQVFEGLPRHVREQGSQKSEITDFGLNVERDLLRAVDGIPKDSSLGTKLAGIDALFSNVRIDLKGVPNLLQMYLEKSEETTYKKDFPWVDNITEERDKAKIVDLQKILVEEIKGKNFDKKWLAPPEIIDWKDFGGFRYGKDTRRDLLAELDFESYADYLVDLDDLTVEKLKHASVSLISGSSDVELVKWSLFKCIYAEIEDNGATYILNNGSWYKIDNDFVSEVDSIVQKIPSSSCLKIDCEKNWVEKDYNKHLAKHISGAFVMDRKNIQFGGGNSKIEFCDVFTPQNHLIHVKPYSGSSTLSHLFSQGAVSGELFIRDSKFRKQVRNKLSPILRSKIPEIKPQGSKYEVAFFIIQKKSKSLSLPFFSKVTLKNVKERLEAFDYKVTLTKVDRKTN
ncbi:MAG: TIGR04141 family sporadically distributed protein [Candidatus Riflebacteria bacterium]|nr:TIGR04141 family sporadically distributed protein [Candidatus Riflebacteria bacterium]